MLNSWKPLLNRSFFLLYLLFFSWMMWIVTHRLFLTDRYRKQYFQFDGIYGKPLHAWGVLAGAAGLTLLLFFLTKRCASIPDHVHSAFAAVCFPVLLLLQLGFGYLFRLQPDIWDFEVIYKAAIGLTEGSNLYRAYFEDYTNNIAITLLMTGVFWLAKWCGIHLFYAVGVLFNIFMIDLGVLLLYYTARRLFGLRLASMALVMGLLYTPFITYVPVFYTDTIPLPLTAGMVYFYLLSRDRAGWRKLLLLILAAVLGTIGVALKATVAILFVAVLLYLVMKERLVRAIWQSALLAAILIGGLQLYASSIDRLQVLSMPYKEAGYPYTHWIMMGLKGPFGFYDPAEVNYTESFRTKERRKQANLAVIRERLHRYGVDGTLRLFSAKALFTWGDGTYFAPVKLNRSVPVYKPYHKYILPLNSNRNTVYIYLCQIFQVSLLFLLLVSGTRQLALRSFSAIAIGSLAIFGLGVFLLCWEARSRYLVHFAPMLLLCGVDGLAALKLPVWELSFKSFWKRKSPI